ncbi:TetR/AcrR family transcriptional regulator [Vibrio sp. HN007]|uniref:TetR/AcrR family transcriptional regulator n=1 Tax=Vibrio iocasae TaxID=3098914 RepID=UPI0035D4A8A3
MTSEITDKRILILNAVEKLVAEEGFEGLSMQKLAKRAGVAAGTIYRYFDDKTHLLREARLHATAKAADIIQAGVSDDLPLKERYRLFWLNIWNYAQTRSAVQTHLLYEQFVPDDIEQVHQLEKEMFRKVDRMFDEGKTTGLFKELDNNVLSGVSLETSTTMARKQRKSCSQLTDDQIEQAIEASWDALIKH